jgi:hypothetical protein
MAIGENSDVFLEIFNITRCSKEQINTCRYMCKFF